MVKICYLRCYRIRLERIGGGATKEDGENLIESSVNWVEVVWARDAIGGALCRRDSYWNRSEEGGRKTYASLRWMNGMLDDVREKGCQGRQCMTELHGDISSYIDSM